MFGGGKMYTAEELKAEYDYFHEYTNLANNSADELVPEIFQNLKNALWMAARRGAKSVNFYLSIEDMVNSGNDLEDVYIYLLKNTSFTVTRHCDFKSMKESDVYLNIRFIE